MGAGEGCMCISHSVGAGKGWIGEGCMCISLSVGGGKGWMLGMVDG